MKTRRNVSTLFLALVAVAALLAAACGQSSTSMNPIGPTTPGPMTITILGQLGSNSFSPNPATVGAGQTIVFRNADSTTHDIVADNGGFDTGNLAPGASSGAITIGSASAISYHCSIHPTMVGSINGTVAPPPSGPGY